MECGRYISLTSYLRLKFGKDIYMTNVVFKNEKWLREDLLTKVKIYLKDAKIDDESKKIILKAFSIQFFDPNTTFLIKHNDSVRKYYKLQVTQECSITFKYNCLDTSIVIKFVDRGWGQLSITFYKERGRDIYWATSYF